MNTDKTQKTRAKVLLLEDDQDLQELFFDYFTPRGYEVICRNSAEEVERDFNSLSPPEAPIDLVVTDFLLPNMNGIELMVLLKKVAPDTPIILVTAHGGLDLALEAIEKGAFDFAVKPIHFPQLAISMERAVHVSQLMRENQKLKLEMDQANTAAPSVVAQSNAMLLILDLAKRVAKSDATVLITGESGTGKEVVAQLIHSSSGRAKKKFVAINCSAIPETLLESELFGHAKGSFTGAEVKKIGLFEEAEGGTLFLDEIGDLSQALQAKLLRVLQDKKIRRVGENEDREIDVRFLAATHKDLHEEVSAKHFREDLFFRLNVIPIKIPPLRERREDIIPLANHFLRRYKSKSGAKIKGFSKAALCYLLKNHWYGNVRELENSLERACVLCGTEWIDEQDFLLPDPERLTQNQYQITEEALMNLIAQQSPTGMAPTGMAATGMTPNMTPSLPSTQSVNQGAAQGPTYTAAQSNPLANPLMAHPSMGSQMYEPQFRSADQPLLAKGEWITLEDLEMRYIRMVLESVNGVKEKAAKILDVDRKTLYRKLTAVAEAQIRTDTSSTGRQQSVHS